MIKVNNRTLGVSNSGGTKKIVASYERDSTRKAGVMSRNVETANVAGLGGGGGGMSVSGIGMNQRANMDTMLLGIINDKQDTQLRHFYRDMYNYDSVAGSAVDFASTLPFSDLSLTGCPEDELEIYTSAIERLQLKNNHAFIRANELIFGEFCATMVFDERSKAFTDMIPYELEQCTIQYSPFTSIDPVVTVRPSKELRNFLESDDEQIVKLRKHIPQKLINNMLEGDFQLDPLTTLYLGRFTHDRNRPTSYFRRILPIYLLEKLLFRGTLVETSRRMRAAMHVQAGIEGVWEPTAEEMTAITELFQKGDLDPLGPIITTRNGINTQEIRQGGDFFKITDIYDQTTAMKLRGLNISESFLSGDINYACLTGDTLISTENGLIPIEQLSNKGSKKKQQDINIKVSGRYQPEKAVKWLYSGYAPTLKITTESGPEIKCTDIHPVLVFNGNETAWVQAKDLKEGYLVCMPTDKLVKANKKLPLELSVPPVHANSSRARNILKAPKFMNSKLGYLLGCIVSEGYISVDPDLRMDRIGFTNTDKNILEAYENYLSDIFNINVCKYQRNSKEGRKDCFDYIVNSKTLVEWLGELGIVTKKEEDKSASHNKVIPWSVLQADRKTQLAFIAAYIDCDGNMGRNRINISSVSNELISQMQSLLSSFGIVTKVSINKTSGVKTIYADSEFASELSDLVAPYLKAKSFTKMPSNKARNSFGFPNSYFADFIKSRKVKHDRHGTIFVNDEGTEILIRGWKNPCNSDKCFLYDKFTRGDYKQFLQDFKKISKVEHGKLVHLLKLRYKYVPITSIVDNGKQHVYDISMEKGKEPAFVANGIIVHNTAEVNLTVYLENLKYDRNSFTQRLYYNKLFPVIAAINKFKHEDTKQNKSRTLHFKVRDASQYRIPKVHWHKSLEPMNDQQAIEMLNFLSEKGVPIPLRMFAAASGLSLEQIESELDDDLEQRKIFAEYQDRVSKELGGEDEGDEGFGGEEQFASATKLPQSGLVKPKLLGRDYGDASEAYVRTVTGKKKSVVNQSRHHANIDTVLAKAIRNLSDPHHYAKTVKAAKSKGLLK
ncbi:MAG: LAGLIDADG family homing endonuclease [Balneolaceae bacterium]